MNDKKLSYTISWTQPYPYSDNFIWIDLTATFEEEVEEQLETGNFTEALSVIDMIRNKQ